MPLGHTEVDLYSILASFFSSAMSKNDAHTPKVDLILVFRASAAPLAGSNKDATRKDAEEAEREYTRLLNTIRASGLRASGKRGQKNGQILVFIWAPSEKLARLIKRERSASFIHSVFQASHPNLSRAGIPISFEVSRHLRCYLKMAQRHLATLQTCQSLHLQTVCALFMNSSHLQTMTAGWASSREARNGHA